MGMGKPDVEFVEEMTEPSGWPDIDEDVLKQRAADLTGVRARLVGTLAAWRRQRDAIGDGGIWSGSAASAAGTSLDTQISKMAALESTPRQGDRVVSAGGRPDFSIESSDLEESPRLQSGDISVQK